MIRRLFVAFALAAAAIAPLSSVQAATYTCFGKPATKVGNADSTIIGTSGNDVLVRGAVIKGLGGNDRICGLKGNDQLFGGKGRDKIDGGGNQDLLVGGRGDDYLDGNKGGFPDGYAQAAGGDAVSYAAATRPVSVNLVTGVATGGGQGTDTLDNFLEIVGSNYGDTLRGGGEWNGVEINGRGGNDTIYGFEGGDSGDFLAGKEGDDKLYGLGNDDTLRGGPGNDLLDGGGGQDRASWGANTAPSDNEPFSEDYPGATGPITANTATGQANGEGTDTLLSVESLIGSEFDDDLNTQDGQAGGIDAKGGTDHCVGDATDLLSNCEN